MKCRVVILQFALSVWGGASANETAYDVATVESYLSAKPLVFFAVRVDGGMTPGWPHAALENIGASFDDFTFDELASDNRARYPLPRVLVLRSLRGTLPRTIEVSPSDSDVFALPLGVPMLVFADRTDGRIMFETCDVENVDRFPAPLLKVGRIGDLVTHIRNQKLLCLRQPTAKRAK